MQEEIKQVIEAKASLAQTRTLNALKDRIFKMPLAILSCVFVIQACAIMSWRRFLYCGPTIFSKIDIGLPSPFLATIPWFELAIGYAASSFVMDGIKENVKISSVLLMEAVYGANNHAYKHT